EKIESEVPIELEGEVELVSKGEADLQRGLHALKVECLPTDLPPVITVDVSRLKEVDDEIRVKDLPVPPGCEILDEPDDLVVKVAVAILILLAFYLLARLVRLLASKELRRVKADPQVALLVNRIVFLTALVIGIIAAFSELFGSPALVFGGFGFLALALSLAFQDILKNFIAGLFMLVERPFRLGDEITVDNHTGIVENIEMRATTLRTSEGEQVITPNSLVYTGTIINRTRYPTRLFTLTAKVP